MSEYKCIICGSDKILFETGEKNSYFCKCQELYLEKNTIKFHNKFIKNSLVTAKNRKKNSASDKKVVNQD